MMDRQERSALTAALCNVVRDYVAKSEEKSSAWVNGELKALTELVEERIRAIPEHKGDKGDPGKDADAEAIRALVLADIESRTKSQPIGEIEIRETILPIILKALDEDAKGIASKWREQISQLIPLPKNGKDADPVDTEAIITEVLKRMPTPKDGKDADIETVRQCVNDAVAALPKPKDGEPGKPGQDAPPIHIDTIRLMIVNEMREQIAALPKPKDGNDGRDCLSLEILPALDMTRSYRQGTCVAHAGGLIIARRQTDPVETSNLQDAGWLVIQEGIADWNLDMDEDCRTITLSLSLTSGKTKAQTKRSPTMIHRDFWINGNEYQRGDAVYWSGSTWVCRVASTKAKPEMRDDWMTADWLLIAKRGRDGKDAEAIKPPTNGQPIRLK